jgi:hypothetical protein
MNQEMPSAPCCSEQIIWLTPHSECETSLMSFFSHDLSAFRAFQ